jgi:hypothetical protein
MKTSRWITGTMYALYFSALVGVLGTCSLDKEPSYNLMASGLGNPIDINCGWIDYSLRRELYRSDSYQGNGWWVASITEDEATAGPYPYFFINAGPGPATTKILHVDKDGNEFLLVQHTSGEGARSESVAWIEPPAPGGGGGGAGWGWTHPTVICAELHRQGLMDETIFEADEAFGRYLGDNDRDVLLGYQLWAKPVVKWMQRSKTATRIVASLATPWSYEMAYRVGARDKGTVEGKILMFVGVPVCRAIGRAMIWAGNTSSRDDTDGHEGSCSREFVIPMR